MTNNRFRRGTDQAPCLLSLCKRMHPNLISQLDMANLFKFVTIISFVILSLGYPVSSQRFSTERTICKLLEDRLVASTAWSEYPIVYEPIQRGRLTIWSGTNTLPTSEFECYTPRNASGTIILSFASFANKLEWTYFDMNKGYTHHGFSVNHQDNVKFKVTFQDNQKDSYVDCNYIQGIEKIELNEKKPRIHTQCSDCGRAVIANIHPQLEELFRTGLIDQIKENLNWILIQLVSNQHFSSPIPFSM